MTLRGESSQSGGHVTTIIQNFTLVSLTSSVTPYPVRLPLGAIVPFLPMHLSFYTLVSLHTCLPMYSSLYALVSLRTRFPMHSSYHYVCISAGRIFYLGIYLRLSSCRDIKVVILDCCNTWQRSWAIDWTQSMLLPYVAVSLVINIGQSN